MTTSAHGLGVTDRQEITDLYARYSHAFDDGQAEECAALFTEDGTAYVQVLRIEAAAVRLVAIGRYRDEFVRDTEGWRIRSRRFTAFTGPALTGTALAAVLDAG